jgi:hypothetical protein
MSLANDELCYTLFEPLESTSGLRRGDRTGTFGCLEAVSVSKPTPDPPVQLVVPALSEPAKYD